jgi:general secretion pathway protein I
VTAAATGRARGFTLLEVMVAMAILSMALVTTFEVVGGALQNHVRARQIETATLLARAKLVELEAGYEEDGFRDFDQEDEGTFEAQGHREVRWQVKAVKPTVELGPEGVVKALTGAEGGLAGLLGLGGQGGSGAGGAGSSALAPSSGGAASGGAAGSALAGPALAVIQQQLTALGEQIKKGVREVRLTVSWPDGKRTESFTVVTHLVVLTPGSQKVDASTLVAPVGPGQPGAAGVQGLQGMPVMPILQGINAGRQLGTGVR